jgi:predicted ATPase
VARDRRDRIAHALRARRGRRRSLLDPAKAIRSHRRDRRLAGDWRRRIQAALGQDGQLIVDLIPHVGLVIGAQPPVAELSLGEAQIRLRRVLRELVCAFATRERPLAVFLDDLPWAAPASLKLRVNLGRSRRRPRLRICDLTRI